MIKKDKKEAGLQENIVMINVIDEKVIPELRKAIKNDESLDRFIKSGQIKEIYNKQNLIVDAGLEVVARLLAGDNTYSGEINYGALGDGSATVLVSDTVMENELYRKLASDSSYDGKIAYVDFFYEKADVAGTFTRFANFIDGTASADSGVMWSHLPVSWTKTLNDGLFVACRYRVYYKV